MKKSWVLLASSSPRRKALLSPFFRLKILNPEINERQNKNESPQKYVKRMALEKWMTAQARTSDRLKHFPLIAADTVVILKNKILGKPQSKSDAKRMIRLLSNRTHRVTTVIAVGKASQKRPFLLKAVTTKVSFRKLSTQDIERFLKSREWQGKAGAYAIQGVAGTEFVNDVRGSLSGVVGLPVNETLQALAQMSAH